MNGQTDRLKRGIVIVGEYGARVVDQQLDDAVAVGVHVHLLEPLLQVHKRLLARHVVHCQRHRPRMSVRPGRPAALRAARSQLLLSDEATELNASKGDLAVYIESPSGVRRHHRE